MPTCCSSSWGGSTIWLASLISPRGEVSATSSWREAFHGDLKRKKNKNKTSLTTVHFGDSVWRLSGMGRQSGKRRCFGLTASYPAAPQTHPECPSFSSCLSLSSISHQVVPPMNRDICHQARNLRRLDLFSRLSQHQLQAPPALSGRWTI